MRRSFATFSGAMAGTALKEYHDVPHPQGVLQHFVLERQAMLCANEQGSGKAKTMGSVHGLRGVNGDGPCINPM